MVFEELSQAAVGSAFGQGLFPVWQEFSRNALQIAGFSAGMAIFTLFIWYYYRLLARRDFFRFTPVRGEGWHIRFVNGLRQVGFVLKYVILFPAISFIFFAILALFLFLLAKEQSIGQILLISITVVAGVRITAYVNEEAARELAKLIPMVLLGVTLVQPNFFSIDLFFDRVFQVPAFVPQIGGFVLFTFLPEVILKALLTAKRHASPPLQDSANR